MCDVVRWQVFLSSYIGLATLDLGYVQSCFLREISVFVDDALVSRHAARFLTSLAGVTWKKRKKEAARRA